MNDFRSGEPSSLQSQPVLQQSFAGQVVEPHLSQKRPKSRGHLVLQVLIVLIALPLISYLLTNLNLWSILDKTLGQDPAANSGDEGLLDLITDGLAWAMLILLLLSLLLKWYRVMRVITLINLVYATIALGVCDVLLVASISQYKGSAGGLQLLGDAAAIWGINIIVFTIWYWFIDGGGPQKRLAGEMRQADLIFPQQASEFEGYTNWKPGLLDYLFLAFNHNMAFSPTDTLILSRRAKILMMLQTTFALLTFAVALSRAIGIVG